MLLRLRNAAASMSELARLQERTANNLANAHTTGFRRTRSFGEVLSARLDGEGAPQSTRRLAAWTDPGAGVLEPTGNPLDLALGGDGFFAVQDAAGQVRYTRAGRFATDGDGTLRTAAGLAVLGADGAPLRLPPGDVQIDAGGAVRVNGQPVGALRVVAFEDPRTLEPLDDALFAAGAPPAELDAPDVRQGFLEGSNVDPIREMSDMIAHVRLYEAQQKLIQATDTLLGEVTRDLGRF